MLKISDEISDDRKRKRKVIDDEPITRKMMIKGKGKMMETAALVKVFDDEENDLTRLRLGCNPTISVDVPPPSPLALSPPLQLSPQYLMGGFSIPDILEPPPWTSYVNQHNYQAQLPTPATTAATAAHIAVGGSNRASSSSSSIQNHRQALPRGRRAGGGANPRVMLRPGKPDLIRAVYPWATKRRATVHTYEHIVAKGIVDISGTVHCKRCEKQYEMAYDLKEEFPKIWKLVAENKSGMCDRALKAWTNPELPTCKFCEEENSARPVIGDKKREINWLFLLLGQLLGCCTLDQLKYFCKHSRNHRTGAKNRVLYLTYLGLCRMLDPNGPFDPHKR